MLAETARPAAAASRAARTHIRQGTGATGVCCSHRNMATHAHAAICPGAALLYLGVGQVVTLVAVDGQAELALLRQTVVRAAVQLRPYRSRFGLDCGSWQYSL